MKQARLIPTKIPQLVRIKIIGSLIIGRSVLAVEGEISAINFPGNPWMILLSTLTGLSLVVSYS